MYPHQHQMSGTRFGKCGLILQMNGKRIEYRMLASYEPQDLERCIACQVGDVIFVKKPFVFNFMGTDQRPEGWLYGTNLQTNQTGYVPAEYVEYVQTKTPPLHRPPPPTPSGGLPTLPEVESTDEKDQPPPIPFRPKPSDYMPVIVPSPQPSPVHSAGSGSVLVLTDQEWYWGNVSRDVVNERLSDVPDGTFLVRNSTNNPGEYTLTLRKGGCNKLIRICHRNGRYGFSDPYNFTSVVDLVKHYRRESLMLYNAELDITLKYPATKQPLEELSAETMEELWRSLREVDQKYVHTSNEYHDIYNDFTTRQQEIQNTKTAISAYEETINMFQEQCSMLNNFLDKARGSHDEHRLIDNFRKMQTRLQFIVEECKGLQKQLREDTTANKKLDRNLNSIKAEMLRLKKLRESKIAFMKSKKVPEERINLELQLDDGDDDDEIYHMPDNVNLREKYPDHCLEKNWFFPDFDRNQAEMALVGMEVGTFLVRKRRARPQTNGPPFACSLVANGEVHHCLIEKTSEGYGFAEPFNLHQTLTDLVLHYAHNSLIPHNEKLDTKLRIPLRRAHR